MQNSATDIEVETQQKLNPPSPCDAMHDSGSHGRPQTPLTQSSQYATETSPDLPCDHDEIT